MKNFPHKDIIQLNNRRSIQKEETRKIILESARSLFNELGFDKTHLVLVFVGTGYRRKGLEVLLDIYYCS